MLMIEPWILNRFPNAQVEPVQAGWSHDRKYKIVIDDQAWLLRVSPADRYAGKQEEFAQLVRLNQVSNAFPSAVDHGLSPDGSDCFVRYEWIQGAEALTVFASLSDEQQFQYGIEAGKLLRIIHDLPQTKVIDSYTEIATKMKVRGQQMRDLQLEFDGYEAMVAFMEANLHLLQNSPTSFRHGDFHLGNMLIDPLGNLRVIDFNRSDFGDPMDDMGKLFTFSRRESIPFSRGQIAGYSPASPETFFKHALCHVLQICAFGLVWAQQFGEAEIAVQHELNAQIMKDFDQLRSVRPAWMV